MKDRLPMHWRNNVTYRHPFNVYMDADGRLSAQKRPGTEYVGSQPERVNMKDREVVGISKEDLVLQVRVPDCNESVPVEVIIEDSSERDSGIIFESNTISEPTPALGDD